MSSTLKFTRAEALGALAAAAPAFALGTPVLAQSPPVKLRLGAVTADAYSEFYYGLDLNVFSKAGFDVDITTFTNGATMAAATIGGSIDIGTGDAVSTVNAIGRGVPLQLIAAGGLYTSNAPTTLLCVAKGSPINSAKALAGQTVAVVSLVSLSSAAVKGWIAKNGGDVDSVKLIELPFGQMGSALARGTIGAAFIAEPTLTAVAADTQVLAKAYDSVAPEFLISIVFTGKEWLAKNSDVAKRFVRAVYQSAGVANEHPDVTAPILAKYSKLDVDLVKAMTRATFATGFNAGQLQPVLDAAAKYKVLDRPFKAADLIAGNAV